jgi:hypothetical protein
MPEAEIAKAVQLLDLMLEFFADDGHWTRGRYDDGNGGHCLVGAVLHLSRKHCLPKAPAIALLQDAMPRPGLPLVHFNDRCCGSVTDPHAEQILRGLYPEQLRLRDSLFQIRGSRRFKGRFSLLWSHLAARISPSLGLWISGVPPLLFSFMGPSTSIRFRIGPVGPPLSLPFGCLWHPPPPPPVRNGKSDGGSQRFNAEFATGWQLRPARGTAYQLPASAYP